MYPVLSKPLWLLTFFTVNLFNIASASGLNAADTADIRATLQKITPNAATALITKTPVAGLYQVQLGMTIVYLSSDGQFLISGGLIELATGDSFGDKALNATRKTAMAKIPQSSMIVYPAKGVEKHVMTVFSDIDCPYCTKLHKEIPALNQAGITVRYLAYPRAGFGSKSYFKAVSAWCADDPAKAMDNAMQGIEMTEKTCVNPVREHMRQAALFEVSGTPNIILDTGELLPGYAPAKALIKAFSSE